jgi:hypothetical protein
MLYKNWICSSNRQTGNVLRIFYEQEQAFIFLMPESEGDMIDTLRQTGEVSGRPTCKFKEIDINCLIQCSTHNGVTPTILKNRLHQMDLLNLFPRVD